MAKEFWHNFREEEPTKEGLYFVFANKRVLLKYFAKEVLSYDEENKEYKKDPCACFCARDREIAYERDVERKYDVLCWAEIPKLPDYCNPDVLRVTELQKQIDELQERLRELTKEEK